MPPRNSLGDVCWWGRAGLAEQVTPKLFASIKMKKIGGGNGAVLMLK